MGLERGDEGRQGEVPVETVVMKGDAQVKQGHVGVPQIDLAGLRDVDQREGIVEAMAEAWRTWGAFLVVNHGVDQSVVEGSREQGMRVFALPMESKLKAWRQDGAFAGYGNGAGSRTSQTADFGSESFRVGFPGPDTESFAEKLWPNNSHAFW